MKQLRTRSADYLEWPGRDGVLSATKTIQMDKQKEETCILSFDFVMNCAFIKERWQFGEHVDSFFGGESDKKIWFYSRIWTLNT